MRSHAEQVKGLDAVARIVMQAACNAVVSTHKGDVVTLRAMTPNGLPGQYEIVYAAGGFDVWMNGVEYIATSVSPEAAAQYIIDEYRAAKQQQDA